MKVYGILAGSVRDQGTSVMFGVMGDANLYMADLYSRVLGGKYVAAADESTAVLRKR